MTRLTEIAALRPYLMRVAMARVGDSHHAEELVHDTILATLSTRAPFLGRSRFRTWVTGILLHKVADLFRRKSRDARMLVEASAHADEAGELDAFDAEGSWRAPPTAWSDPQLALESKRFRAVLRAGLSRLPPQQLRAFKLREVEGLEVEEVCAAMQITPNNMWVLLHRARMQLRQSLERDYFSSTA